MRASKSNVKQVLVYSCILNIPVKQVLVQVYLDLTYKTGACLQVYLDLTCAVGHEGFKVEWGVDGIGLGGDPSDELPGASDRNAASA
jgi:hypothetical protein